MSSLAAARELLRRGWAVIPVPTRAKKPILDGWPQLRLHEEDLAEHFSNGENIGILTGEPSGGLIDIDLDCSEAVNLADSFLPPTAMVSGRPSRPRSHRWYQVTGSIPDNATFKDVDKDATTLLELRGTGRQTVVAPSIHPDGDQYLWEGPLEPAEATGAALDQRTRHLAAATLLVRHWPTKPGSRHDMANALAGMLLRAGWTQTSASEFIGVVARAAGDEEAKGRARDAVATANSLARGRRVTGGPTLRQLFGDEVVDRLEEWLGLRDTAFTAFTAYPREESNPWPAPLGEEAYFGLAGEFVHIIEPHTESDPAAILLQLLTSAGNCIGRGPHFRVEADEHHMNLFVGIVGKTAKARKGTSWGQTKRHLGVVDEAWAKNCIANGLSSGEGLIWAVRDKIVKNDPIRKGGRVVGYQEVVADPGIEDKRLLVVESELASTLRVLAREGNTLSSTIRSAWETGDLRTLTKNSPARATSAHISILGHITKEELVRNLDTTEIANGFANRFLWLCVQRSKLLPEGGRSSELDLRPFHERLGAAIHGARRIGQLSRGEEARELWYSVYGPLSEGKSGLFGAAISRAEAQVTRLSCLFALLDGSPTICVSHLQAALAVWRYCEDSARYIFGDRLGDPVADGILKALRANPDGLTRDDVRNLLGRNQPAARIDLALRALMEQQLARVQREETGGRPAERWFAQGPYAINAVNAERGRGEVGYRVNSVNGVAQSADASATPEPDEPTDDEAVL